LRIGQGGKQDARSEREGVFRQTPVMLRGPPPSAPARGASAAATAQPGRRPLRGSAAASTSTSTSTSGGASARRLGGSAAAAAPHRRRSPLPHLPPRAPRRSIAGAAADAAGAASPTDPPPPPSPPASLPARVRRFFFGDGQGKKLDRAAIAKLGAGGFLAYGGVSNVNYGVAIGVSWIAFVKKYGVSPLGDQWPAFLAFYAAMWTLQNFLRPARFALAVALAPSANRLIDAVGARTGFGRRGAFALLLLAMAVTMTSTLGLALWAFGGFPPAK